jgi:hypothetical protein
MKALIGVAVLALATVAVAADEKLGAGVTLKEATPIASLVNHPDQYVGKTVRVDGVGTAVCEMMGCWIAITEDGAKDGKTIRVKVEDGVIKIPVTAKGKKVSAEGVFEVVADEHGEEAAAEHAKQQKPQAKVSFGEPTAKAKHPGEHTHDAASVTAKYQIKGTGLVIR